MHTMTTVIFPQIYATSNNVQTGFIVKLIHHDMKEVTQKVLGCKVKWR
jgi:hypothetical protein